MSFKPYQDPTHLYFITASLCGWKQLFVQPAYAQIVLESLNWHRRNGRMRLYAFVLMPDHLHGLVMPLDETTISTLLQSFGSFTAHAIVQQLRKEQRLDLLEFFQRQQCDVTKKHRIWQPLQAKNVYSMDYLRQKLEYIHNNPTNKRWRLVEIRADYRYSSACFYDRGEEPIIAVEDVREWF